MSKKNWLIIVVAVLVVFGIYFYNSDVGLSPTLNKNVPGTDSEINERSCSNYHQLDRMTEDQINSCLDRYREAVEKVAREFASTLSKGEDYELRSDQEGCVGDVNEDWIVDDEDIEEVIRWWGCGGDCIGDADGSGRVNVDDLLLVLANFGCISEVEGEYYIFTGTTNHVAALLLADSGGEEEWRRTSPAADTRESLQKTEDGGYVFVERGIFLSSPSSLIKTNSIGVIEWEKLLGEEGVNRGGRAVQQTEDGGYILLGIERILPDDDMMAFLVKTNSVGETLWSRTFEDYDSVGVIQQSIDGGFIFLANKFITSYLVKTNSVGEIEWSKTYEFSGSFMDWLKDLKLTSDGGYILVGQTFEITDYASSAAYLVKTNSEGIEEWVKTFGRDEWAEPGNMAGGESVQQTEDGGYVFAGDRRFSSGDSFEAYLVKTDSNGNEEWSKTFGGYNFDYYVNSVQQTEDGGYVFAGEKEYDNQKQIYLAKTYPNGEKEWISTLGIGSGNSVHVVQF